MSLFNTQPFNASNLFSGVSNLFGGQNPTAPSSVTATPKGGVLSGNKMGQVPTADQTQQAKIAAGGTVKSSTIPGVTGGTTGTTGTTTDIPTSNPVQKQVIADKATNPFSSQSSVPTPQTSPLSNYDAARENAYQASAPIDLNKLAPYSQQIEEANRAVANATNAQRDFERGTYNQAIDLGSVNPNQLQTELSAGNRLLNQNIADASTNQLAANQTLATQLALQQALRTGKVEQAQIPFTTATPVTVAPGNSLINPYSGVTVANGGGNVDIPSLATQVINGQMTQDDANKLIAYNPTLAAQLNQEIQKQNPTFSRVNQEASIGADTSSLQAQQGAYDTNRTVLDTVTTNGKNILNLMARTGVSNTGLPAIAALQQGVNNKVLTSDDVSAFKEALNTLRSNYAQINAKGGSVTQENKDAALQAIPDTISIGGLQAVLEQMWNGANTNLMASQKTIENIKGRLGTSATFKPGQTNSTGDLKWDGSKWVPNK